MSRSTFHVDPAYQPAMREIGLDADTVFNSPDIKVWRSITERDNATLDAMLADGTPLRWHVKRYRTTRRGMSPARDEVEGLRLLEANGIPTVKLVGFGHVPDGRSFIITEDLSGFAAADQLIQSGGATFEALCPATADLAGALHDKALHHRDLYLCHFFAKVENGKVEIRLIDAGRVARLPRWPFGGRWIVKDLSQFWYSAQQLGVPEPARRAWLERYARRRGLPSADPLRHAIERKANWIARHDERLRAQQPARNVSIPPPAPSPAVLGETRSAQRELG
ncbi:MAG TPA: lipopolysaccharide kinase InaA family protein [Tepidisphaeraceae bacterium]|nr:lipopolysaccharide kinase InaA family protein [Tepidisphaeraceae bacterium]